MLGDGPPDGSEFFKSLQRCNEHKHLHANDKVTVEDGGEFSALVSGQTNNFGVSFNGHCCLWLYYGAHSDDISVSRLWKSLPTTSKGTNGAICACLVVGGHGGDCLNEFTLEFGLDIWHNCSVA